MPVHDAIRLCEDDLYQTSATGPSPALTGLRPVNGSVRSAHQPLACAVKELVGLVIHLHGDMGTLVEIGIDLPLKSDRKTTRSATAVDNIEGNRRATVCQIAGVAQGQNA